MPFSPEPGDYLAFVGRVTPEKGIREALELAQLTGLRLRAAAKVHAGPEQEHFDEVVQPALDADEMDFLGEVGPSERDPLFAGALATVMLGGWPEPFGLVAIESMATGTPVIARRAGAFTETIEHGVTGFLVDDVTEAAMAVEKVRELDRRVIRERTLARFSPGADGGRVRARVPPGARHAARRPLAFGHGSRPIPTRRPARAATARPTTSTRPTIPGPDAARAQARGGGARGGGDRAAGDPRRAPDPRRDGVLDRPDDDRGRRVLPVRRRHRGGAPRLLRLALPGGRGGRDLLRAPVAPPVRAVGGADAARLRVRHQGARPAHRPAHRDEAPAEGAPRGAARRRSPTKARLYAKDLPGELLAEVWRQFADGLAPLAEAGQLGAVFLQYPKWFFTSSENRDAIREAKAALEPYGLRVAVEFRNASWFNEKNVERTLRFLEDEAHPARHGRRAAGLQVVRAAGRRGDVARPRGRPVPRAPDGHLGGDGRAADRRAVPLPVRPRRARGVGAARARRRRAAPRTRTS